MVDKDFLLQKIWGSWTGKIAGGTFGMPVEGRDRRTIVNMHLPHYRNTLRIWDVGYSHLEGIYRCG